MHPGSHRFSSVIPFLSMYPPYVCTHYQRGLQYIDICVIIESLLLTPFLYWRKGVALRLLMETKLFTTKFVRIFFILISGVLLSSQTALAAVSYSQTVTLQPGWNIVSTPRILESHNFSMPETSTNLSVFMLDASDPSGWAPMSGEFAPLYGYFINNKTATSQTLTFNFKASTTPNERLFDRSFATSGWYSIGVANPTYADRQGEANVDENNPSQVFDSVIASTDLVVDFTDADSVFSPASVALADPWGAAIATDVNTLADIRDTKGYAIYINTSGSHYIGFQNESDDGGTGSVPTYTPGTLSITKAADSPSGNVIQNGSGVTLGKFTFQAQGERLKVENLKVALTSSDTSWGSIRNGALFANGVQVGSTNNILTATGTQFNLGSSLIIDAGQSVTIEVRGDIYDNDGTNDSSSGDTIKVQLLAGTSNVYRLTTLDYISSESKSANIVTVAEATLALAKYASYANQTIIVPQTAFKIGEYRLTAGADEGVNLDTITLALGGSATVTHLTNLYVVYGSKTSTVKATGATSQQWSINEALSANGTMSIAVYADMSGSILSASTTITTLTLSGTGQGSGSPVTSPAVTGQTITAGEGVLTGTVDSSTPISALLVGNSMPKVASFKFTASNDSFTITELAVTAKSVADASAVTELVFKDGATEIRRVSYNGAVATATGLSVVAQFNATKVIDVYANLGSIGTGFVDTGANVGITLTSFKAQNSNGVNTTHSVSLASNDFYAHKTKPTLTNVALPTSVLSSGTVTIAKVNVTADAGGTLAWRKIVWNVATSSPGTFTVGSPAVYDAANESTPLANVTTSIDPSTGVITVTSTVDQEVSGSKTYVLKATIGGSVQTGASVSTSIAGGVTSHSVPTTYAGAASNSSFVWSDESVVGHSDTTTDWMDNYLVKNLPTDSQTLTK